MIQTTPVQKHALEILLLTLRNVVLEERERKTKGREKCKANDRKINENMYQLPE
jgi:hypothetical protein